jgi:hypothetical protein
MLIRMGDPLLKRTLFFEWTRGVVTVEGANRGDVKGKAGRTLIGGDSPDQVWGRMGPRLVEAGDRRLRQRRAARQRLRSGAEAPLHGLRPRRRRRRRRRRGPRLRSRELLRRRRRPRRQGLVRAAAGGDGLPRLGPALHLAHGGRPGVRGTGLGPLLRHRRRHDARRRPAAADGVGDRVDLSRHDRRDRGGRCGGGGDVAVVLV